MLARALLARKLCVLNSLDIRLGARKRGTDDPEHQAHPSRRRRLHPAYARAAGRRRRRTWLAWDETYSMRARASTLPAHVERIRVEGGGGPPLRAACIAVLRGWNEGRTRARAWCQMGSAGAGPVEGEDAHFELEWPLVAELPPAKTERSDARKDGGGIVQGYRTWTTALCSLETFLRTCVGKSEFFSAYEQCRSRRPAPKHC
jgi:hypothetical protein